MIASNGNNNMDIESYSSLAIQYYQSKIPSLLLKYLPSKFTTILDCGCGDGSLINSLLKSKNFQNKIIYAIDLSKNRISLIKRNFGKQIIAYVDNAEKLSRIKTNSIDIFITEQVIEHVNDKKMIQNLTRVTKKDSLIYLSTVIKSKYAWYFYVNSTGKHVLDPTHLREYPDEISIIKLFNKNNFQILKYQKKLFHFPISDLIFKIFKIKNRQIYSHWFLKIFRKLSIPIPGYYKFEIVLLKIN